MQRVRAALYLDFDNVFGGLFRLDPAAAIRFAENPGTWLEALESRQTSGGPRRWLVRRCYLNPAGSVAHPDTDSTGARLYFSRFRPYFTRAGFDVVDCPPADRLTTIVSPADAAEAFTSVADRLVNAQQLLDLIELAEGDDDDEGEEEVELVGSPGQGGPDADVASELPDTPEAVERVVKLLGLPRLAPPMWAAVYEVLAEYSRSFSFNLTEATRWSRDELAKRGRPVGRQAIGFVVRGSMYGGAPLSSDPPPGAEAIRDAFLENVLRRAEAADIEVSSMDSEQIRAWFGGDAG